MENANLDLFLIEMGILPKVSDISELEDLVEVENKYACLEKGYFNDPRNEYGEVPF